MNVFTTWQDAHAFASKRAAAWQTPQGIEKIREYGKTLWKVRSLPVKGKRFGVDAACEAVEPPSISMFP